MKFQILFAAFFSMAFCHAHAQNEVTIGEKDGVVITYNLIVEDDGDKKDKYILMTHFVNNNDKDVYYEVPLQKNDAGQWVIPTGFSSFSTIQARNATGLFDSGVNVTGEKTDLITTNNTILFKLSRGNIYTQETTFKVKTGEEPLLTNTFSKSMKELSSYDLQISSAMLEGDYMSSCGDIRMNVSHKVTAERGEHLLQTVNGKQFIWLRKSDTSFVRENSNDFSLTFDKSTESFFYSISDGVTCSWTK